MVVLKTVLCLLCIEMFVFCMSVLHQMFTASLILSFCRDIVDVSATKASILS